MLSHSLLSLNCFGVHCQLLNKLPCSNSHTTHGHHNHGSANNDEDDDDDDEKKENISHFTHVKQIAVESTECLHILCIYNNLFDCCRDACKKKKKKKSNSSSSSQRTRNAKQMMRNVMVEKVRTVRKAHSAYYPYIWWDFHLPNVKSQVQKLHWCEWCVCVRVLHLCLFCSRNVQPPRD